MKERSNSINSQDFSLYNKILDYSDYVKKIHNDNDP